MVLYFFLELQRYCLYETISSDDFTHLNVLVVIRDQNACGLTHVSSHLRRIDLARLCKGSLVVCTHTNVKYQVMDLGRNHSAAGPQLLHMNYGTCRTGFPWLWERRVLYLLPVYPKESQRQYWDHSAVIPPNKDPHLC